jgi:hypothetical protein
MVVKQLLELGRECQGMFRHVIRSFGRAGQGFRAEMCSVRFFSEQPLSQVAAYFSDLAELRTSVKMTAKF